MTAETARRLLDLVESLATDLDEANANLWATARAFHEPDAREVLPPARRWMVGHLLHVQTELRGAQNHVEALLYRLHCALDTLESGEL